MHSSSSRPELVKRLVSEILNICCRLRCECAASVCVRGRTLLDAGDSCRNFSSERRRDLSKSSANTLSSVSMNLRDH